MEGLELVVILGATLLVGGLIASRIRVPAPLVLIVIGSGIGFLPFLSDLQLPPDVVLLLFLPALLYWEAFNSSWREIRRNLRVILLMSVGLTLATAVLVAVIAHAFGLPWSIAIALGAILAPTDATAVSAIAGRLPRRQATTLRAESLINDGTALTLYAVAVAAAVSGGDVSIGETSLRFLLSYGVALLVGLVIGFATRLLRRVIGEDRLLANTLSVLTPFLAYLPAEALHASGVVAVVTTGLVVSQVAVPLISARTRSQAYGFWQLATYLLNGALFVLIGVQLHSVIEGLDGSWGPTLLLGLAATAAVIVARLAWINTTPYLIRMVDRRPVQRTRRISFRQRIPLGWAGFRGAVSLAAALALPAQTASGDPLPGRDVVIAVTFVVILLTLFVQGLTLPAVVKWGRLPDDPTELDERLLADQVIVQAVLDELDGLAERLRTPDATVTAYREMLEERLARIHRSDDDPSVASLDEDTHDSRLRLAALQIKRDALFDLRDSGRIDDVILRRTMAHIDIEELRLSAVDPEND